jgi:hypothetical protein
MMRHRPYWGGPRPSRQALIVSWTVQALVLIALALLLWYLPPASSPWRECHFGWADTDC